MITALTPRLDYPGPQGPLLLIIMDGFGLAPPGPANAISQARTPHLDAAFAQGIMTTLKAHGTAVGLPSDDDMGNSEVGHNALGAGRIFAQGALLVNQAIESGTLFSSSTWTDIMARQKDRGTLHFIGLLSDGNVHSHIRHLYALLDRARSEGVRRVRLHILLDGRDVGEKSALDYVLPLEATLAEWKDRYDVDYRIASGGGRMHVTMDRYNADWRIVQRGYEAHVLGKGRGFPSASDAVRVMYAEDPAMTDQYMESFVITDNGRPVGPVLDGDSMILFNFRGDRAIEFSRAMTEASFTDFPRPPLPDVLFAGMMEYDGDLHVPPRYLVQPPSIDHTMGEYLCASGVPSFAISETQKFGHVTYFWNGNNSGYIDASLETYTEIPSDRIAFDRAPAMKAKEITDAALELLTDPRYRFGRINFANGDMVGHTGNLDAAISAIEAVDEGVGRLIEAVRARNGIVILTADHGNADEMFTEKNGVRTPKTSHTLAPVPFCVLTPDAGPRLRMVDVPQRGLANVAATILTLLGYVPPAIYEPSLFSVEAVS